jgi:hypothetical protein
MTAAAPARSPHSTIAVITFNDVPAINHSFKYDVLGNMALENRRQYCEMHGYDFISEVPIARDRPACWAKIPAILAAFETHEWVLWADSDTLVIDRTRKLESFCDPACDLVVQTHDRYYQLLGIPLAEGIRRMPINTGVFLIRATAWSHDFLRRAYAQTAFVSHGAGWDGIGEQEAMIALLHRAPQDQRRIRHVDFLQAPPRFYRPGYMFMHFYGNHARHRISPADCNEVLNRWGDAVRHGTPLPRDYARFHWCCIQNRSPANPVAGGDLPKYLYRPEDILPVRQPLRGAGLA